VTELQSTLNMILELKKLGLTDARIIANAVTIIVGELDDRIDENLKSGADPQKIVDRNSRIICAQQVLQDLHGAMILAEQMIAQRKEATN